MALQSQWLKKHKNLSGMLKRLPWTESCEYAAFVTYKLKSVKFIAFCVLEDTKQMWEQHTWTVKAASSPIHHIHGYKSLEKKHKYPTRSLYSSSDSSSSLSSSLSSSSLSSLGFSSALAGAGAAFVSSLFFGFSGGWYSGSGSSGRPTRCLRTERHKFSRHQSKHPKVPNVQKIQLSTLVISKSFYKLTNCHLS